MRPGPVPAGWGARCGARGPPLPARGRRGAPLGVVCGWSRCRAVGRGGVWMGTPPSVKQTSTINIYLLNCVKQVRNARTAAPATHFLGVRLNGEEESLLEKFRTANELPNRSEAVRALVRGGGGASVASVELPTTLRAELEEIVEDGYARDLDGAVAIALHLGLGELARTHVERMPALRERARSTSERRRDRRRADREGRGLLGR
jgi:Arc/MetJ-type ribon-helix-helix transcriptional regulator